MEIARLRRARELALWTAWHVAAFSRTDRLPDLRELMDRVSGDGDDREQDPEEQLAAARMIAALFGSDGA